MTQTANSYDVPSGGFTVPVADCYSAGERGWMEATQRWRARTLEPLLRGLCRWHVTPDVLTLLSLASGLAFCVVWGTQPIAAMGALLLHVLLDGLDGPLARWQGVASRRGSFTDSMADQAVVTGVVVTLMANGVVSVMPGTLYLAAYGALVIFAMIRNALSVPYTWLIRPRLAVYAWIAVETWLSPGTIDPILWACVAVLLPKVVSGFVRIRSRL